MWTEKETPYGFRLVENENGATLGYSPDSGLKLLENDGFVFKDMAGTGELLPYEDWRLTPEERAADLAARLSPEEIAGLMCFSGHQIVFEDELTDEQKTFLDLQLRSILNSGGLVNAPDEKQIHWNNLIQRYVEGKGHSIPCYIASDPRNGQGVSDWPVNLSLAATFDPKLAETAAQCQSRELRDLGVTCFLAPQVDVASDPRWYRFSGTFGEDPALSRDLTQSFCDGLQSTVDEDGNDVGWGARSVTAMVKHWTGEAACEGGREAHLEGGKYAVYPGGNFEGLMIPFVDGAFRLKGKTGCVNSVMSSYSIAWSEDGSLGERVGSGYSQYKIKELLRNRCGFDGSVCTDWRVLNEDRDKGELCCGWGEGIEPVDGRDPDAGALALRAVMAGVDQLGGCANPKTLLSAYRIGCETLSKEAADALFQNTARRLLLGYFRTGLFENPYLDEAASLRDVNSPDKQAAALEAQIRSIVMLKNEKTAVRAHEKRPKVYLPALAEAAYQQLDHRRGMLSFEACFSWPIAPEVAAKYCDVITDRVENGKLVRLTKEEIGDVDFVLITAREPGNTYQQAARNEKGEFIPISRQYRPYTANGPAVRRVSIAGDPLPDGGRENRSYYGRSSIMTNEAQLDEILHFAALARELGVPSVVAMFTGKPLCFHEFEPFVDAILVTFSTPSLYGGGTASAEALMAVAAGAAEPSGLLPCQMPRDMEAVEAQLEDLPRDMACYVDTAGHRYDFAYGLNYGGVIRDERVERYAKPALRKPEHL